MSGDDGRSNTLYLAASEPDSSVSRLVGFMVAPQGKAIMWWRVRVVSPSYR